jgi:maltose alpha-D-glucosyltransferase/alpha-amylase
VVAAAQAFVKSSGDGWNFVLDLLRRHLSDESSDALLEVSIPVARRLGQVTAGMHLALASDPWSPDLAPEVILGDDAARWSADYLSMLDTITAEIRRIADRLDARLAELAATYLGLAPGLRKRTIGFERLIGRQKIRVHGDYHLGQLLHRIDGDFAVIDFEGEPQRTIEERRRKTSPLKDVAGMLRSFSYARGTATGWLSESGGLLASDLVAWERTMRREFLQAYVTVANTRGANLLPASSSDLQSAVSAWELDKAVYEVQYELNNRPDWLWIPLSAMLKQSEPDV